MKVQIFLNIEFDFNGQPEMLKMSDDFPPTQMTIDSMIQTAIMVFNEKLETKRSQYRINPTENVWSLYMSKKNGKPKQDLPALDRDNLLSESGTIDMFTLHTKDNDKLWQVTSDKWKNFLSKQDNGSDDNDSDNNNTNNNSYFNVNNSTANNL